MRLIGEELNRPVVSYIPRWGVLVAFMMSLLATAASRGQVDTLASEIPHVGQVEEFSPALTALALVLFPKVVADVRDLREYVRGSEFAAFRHTRGDIVSVDALFRRALSLAWNNRAEALFIVTLAVMDHRRVGIRTPIPGLVLWFPLTSEFDPEFHERVNSLPGQLYPDSPPAAPGDRDKLQHFFGSALLALVSESGRAAARVGEFVEWGEDAFIVGGTLDERDLRANRQGITFGLSLLEDITSLPSQFMREDGLPSPAGAVPVTSGNLVP